MIGIMGSLCAERQVSTDQSWPMSMAYNNRFLFTHRNRLNSSCSVSALCDATGVLYLSIQVGNWTDEFFRLCLENPSMPLWITAAQPSVVEQTAYFDNGEHWLEDHSRSFSI